MMRSVPSSSRSIRSALPRTRDRARRRLALERERPSNAYSSSRSTTPMPCSISKAKARSPARARRPTRADRSARARGRLRAAPASCASATSSNSASASSRFVGRDRAAAGVAPRIEERFEHPVQQLAALERRQPGFVLALLLELQHLAGEVLERALEIPLDAADRVDDGARARRPLPWIARRPPRAGARQPQREPVGRVAGERPSGRDRRERQRLVVEDADGRARPRRARRRARRAATSSRNGDGGTIASSSSVNVETETALAGQRQQIVESRARRGQAIGVGRPAEIAQQRRRIEDAGAGALRPVRLDEPDERARRRDRRRPRRRRRAAARPSRAGPRRERLRLDPSADGRDELGDRQRPIVVALCASRERRQCAEHGGARPQMALVTGRRRVRQVSRSARTKSSRPAICCDADAAPLDVARIRGASARAAASAAPTGPPPSGLAGNDPAGARRRQSGQPRQLVPAAEELRVLQHAIERRHVLPAGPAISGLTRIVKRPVRRGEQRDQRRPASHPRPSPRTARSSAAANGSAASGSASAA